jgi:hypothetical protein
MPPAGTKCNRFGIPFFGGEFPIRRSARNGIGTEFGLLWWWRLKYGVDDKSVIVTGTMLTIVVPLCLGLIVVSVLLPSLTRLKVTGLEAELSQQQGKETPASGPKGQIGFSSSSLAACGVLAGGARARAILLRAVQG